MSLLEMKILLLIPFYVHLEDDVIEELGKQGHSVFVLEDKMLPYIDIEREFKTSMDKFITKIKHVFNIFFDLRKRYWKKMIKKTPQLNESYDFFLCINGVSFSSYLMKHIKKINPKIRTSLYIWDSDKYRDYFRSVPFFDACFSFDWGDCFNNKNVTFLPFFWKPVNKPINELKYDVSIIGSAHDGRERIVSSVEKQLKRDGHINYMFRIYVPKDTLKEKKSFYNRIKLYIKKTVLGSNRTKDDLLKNLYWDEDFIVHETIPTSDVMKTIMQSKCVLDTDRGIQTGTTPRLIWALAYGKKIITTNSSIHNTPFYTEQQIQIIDRNNPIVDVSFLKDNVIFDCPAFLRQCRIDNWVKILLGEKCMERIF